MAAREVAVKRYVVRLSAEERERLEALRTKGKIPARRLTKALILLKADVSDAGEGWSNSEIIRALDTTKSMLYCVRKPRTPRKDWRSVRKRACVGTAARRNKPHG